MYIHICTYRVLDRAAHQRAAYAMAWPVLGTGVVREAVEDGCTLLASSIVKLGPLRTMPSLHVGLQGFLRMLTGTTWDYQLSFFFDTAKIQGKEWSIRDQQHLNITGMPPKERRTLSHNTSLNDRALHPMLGWHGGRSIVKSETGKNIPLQKQGSVRSVKANIHDKRTWLGQKCFILARDFERQFDGGHRPRDVDPSFRVFACLAACRHTCSSRYGRLQLLSDGKSTDKAISGRAPRTHGKQTVGGR